MCGAAAAVLAVLVAATPAAASEPASGNVVHAASGQCTADTRIPDAPPAFQTLQAERAWTLTRGDGIVVAVVDSGVDAANPHLSGAVLKGVNLVDDDADSTGRSDDYGHGTAIAGQIAARGISGSGMIGLAPGAKILPVRVYADVDDQAVKAGTGPDIARLARGIRYATDHGAQIINVALSTASHDSRLIDAVEYATGHGSLVVASAGNRDQSASVASNDRDGARYPAAAEGALGVAATGADGVVTSDSIHGPHVALSAPGQNILSVSPAGGDCIFAADAPATSYATGYVSAAAALVAATFPSETPAQWAYRLEVTARRANPDARDDVSGWGIVQPYSALTVVPGADLRGPANPFVDVQQSPAPEASAAPIAVHEQPPANAQAWALASVVGVVALAALGTIGTLGMLRRRRENAGIALDGRGLYGDEPQPEE